MANHKPRDVQPSKRDLRAAELIIDKGESVHSALKQAGFPESRARMGNTAIKRSKGLRLAVMAKVKKLSELSLPDPEARAKFIWAQLLINAATNTGAKGSNQALRSLSSKWA